MEIKVYSYPLKTLNLSAHADNRVHSESTAYVSDTISADVALWVW